MSLAEAPKEIDGHGLLTGKVVIVTAAAGTGIGFAVARRALAEGADVVVSDHHERRLGETRDQLTELGLGRVESVVCDVTSTAQVDALISSTTARMGRLDVLVNNAGLGGTTPVVDMTDEEWDRVLNVTLTSTMRATRAALRILPRGGPWRRDRQQRKRAGLAGATLAVPLCGGQGGCDGADPLQRNRSRRIRRADQCGVTRALPGTSSWRRPARRTCWTGCRRARRSVGRLSRGRLPPPSRSWPATTPVTLPAR